MKITGFQGHHNPVLNSMRHRISLKNVTISMTLKLDQVRTFNFFLGSKAAFILITGTIRFGRVHYIPKRNKNPAFTKFIMPSWENLCATALPECHMWLTAKLCPPQQVHEQTDPSPCLPTSPQVPNSVAPEQSSSRASLSTITSR
jgi:hypothetical protein